VNKTLTIFGGNSNAPLSAELCEHLGIVQGRARVERFSDGEIFVEIGENVRGVNCFLMQSTCSPPNRNLMELLIMIDALKRASAGSIVALMPYFGYARQDRKVKPRTPISAKLVADLLTAAGATRVLAVDLHAGQIQGFFNIPFDHLYATPVFRETLKLAGLYGNDVVIVSPDAGGVERARIYSKMLECSLAIIDKRRESAERLAGAAPHRRRRRQAGHPRRRHHRHRRHPVQRGVGGAPARRDRGLRGRHPRGAVRPGDRAHQQIGDQADLGDQLDPAGGPAGPLRPPDRGQPRPAAGRGGQAHPPRRLHLEPVLLSRSADNDLCLTGGEAQSCGYPPGGTTREEEKRQ
jgi:phosphoribosylpyrophosphate synthetase